MAASSIFFSSSSSFSSRRCFLLVSPLQNLILTHHYHTNTTTSNNLHSNPSKTPHNSTNAPETFTPVTVLEALSSYANDWKSALEFFQWVEAQSGFRHTTETYNKLIDVLGKFFEFDKCWDLIANMSKYESSMPNHATFRVMFKRYSSARLVSEAIRVFDELGEFDLRDEVSFSCLVDALCEYKHVVEAEELFLKVRGEKSVFFVGGWSSDLDTKIHNIILRGWAKMGWWSKCREFWEAMDKRGVRKDLHSYSIYMDIQCKCKKPWKAVRLYKEVKRKGIQLDVVAYNTLIRAVGLSDGVDAAVRVLKKMVELRCDPNVVTYNTIVKLLCENGRYREVYRMLNEMSEKGCDPNVITYHCVFGCLEKPKEILRLFDRMIDSGVQPQVDTYVMLMRKFGRWGFLRPVFIVWEKMEAHGLSPDVFAYNALIDALVQKGMIDLARKYDEEMLAKGLSAKPRAELEGRG